MNKYATLQSEILIIVVFLMTEIFMKILILLFFMVGLTKQTLELKVLLWQYKNQVIMLICKCTFNSEPPGRKDLWT